MADTKKPTTSYVLYSPRLTCSDCEAKGELMTSAETGRITSVCINIVKNTSLLPQRRILVTLIEITQDSGLRLSPPFLPLIRATDGRCRQTSWRVTRHPAPRPAITRAPWFETHPSSSAWNVSTTKRPAGDSWSLSIMHSCTWPSSEHRDGTLTGLLGAGLAPVMAP